MDYKVNHNDNLKQTHITHMKKENNTSSYFLLGFEVLVGLPSPGDST